jgi:hypothetical protein
MRLVFVPLALFWTPPQFAVLVNACWFTCHEHSVKRQAFRCPKPLAAANSGSSHGRTLHSISLEVETGAILPTQPSTMVSSSWPCSHQVSREALPVPEREDCEPSRSGRAVDGAMGPGSLDRRCPRAPDGRASADHGQSGVSKSPVSQGEQADRRAGGMQAPSHSLAPGLRCHGEQFDVAAASCLRRHSSSLLAASATPSAGVSSSAGAVGSSSHTTCQPSSSVRA